MTARSPYSSIRDALQFPIFAGVISALLCAIGMWLFLGSQKSVKASHHTKFGVPPSTRRGGNFASREIIYSLISACAISVVVLYWSSSLIITAPFSFFALLITWTYFRNRKIRDVDQLLEVWPEVTDHLISGLHSGMSLSEALAGLSTRGPLVVRPHFLSFQEDLLKSGDFTMATEKLRDMFSSHGSDQIFEAILLAKSLGGSELLQIFRTLGDFLRQDLAVRKEIEIKHGWIKNSAHLSSAAPWLLLLLLSSQPATARAFNQPSGMIVLAFGLVLTGLAYFWMGKLGRMPSSPRVFKGASR